MTNCEKHYVIQVTIYTWCIIVVAIATVIYDHSSHKVNKCHHYAYLYDQNVHTWWFNIKPATTQTGSKWIYLSLNKGYLQTPYVIYFHYYITYCYCDECLLPEGVWILSDLCHIISQPVSYRDLTTGQQPIQRNTQLILIPSHKANFFWLKL